MKATLPKYLTKSTHFQRSIWVLLLFFLGGQFPSSNAFAITNYKLKVTVTDASSGEPLIGVNVFTDDMGFAGSTDLDGIIILENIEHREIVHFSYLGYQKVSLPFKRIRDLKGRIMMAEGIQELAVV